MSVQPKVNGSLGESVILPCVFTHPKQNNYKRVIIVKWMKGSELIFNCNLHNKTNSQDNNNCTVLSSSEKLSLNGNPMEGDISLRISNLQFTDATRYFCRVELDYNKCSSTHTELNINGEFYTFIQWYIIYNIFGHLSRTFLSTFTSHRSSSLY